MNEEPAGAPAGVAAEERHEESARAARALGRAEAEVGVTVEDIPLDRIDPDPTQPRRLFDEERLRSLAESIRKYGVLQEPGVVPVAGGDAGGPRYRLVWGERRWRASRVAGLVVLRCKVLPRNDQSTVEQLRAKEQQWAENMEREGLSPIEEAIAIQDAVDLERKLRPEAPLGELIERTGAARGLNGIVARNLVGLLKAPRSLQSGMMTGSIGREVGFELARFWNKLLADNELRGDAKREIQYRRVIEAWARERGAELDGQAMARYATETFQDPKIVKATCRKAEASQRAVLERFDVLVARAIKECWTVEKAKSELTALRAKEGARKAKHLPCYEQARKGTRLTVHLDRVRNPDLATPESLANLLGVLRDLTSEVESRRTAAVGGPLAG
jgi:ParB family chromosome partitioning protein